MIEGIEIISKEPIKEIPVWFFLVVAGVFILRIIIGYITEHTEKRITETIMTAIRATLTLVVLAAFGMLMFWPGIKTGRYTYNVTIDNTVSVTDLYEHYEIVEQNGDTYIIQDKENE